MTKLAYEDIPKYFRRNWGK